MKSTVQLLRDRVARAESKGDEEKARKLRNKIAKVEDRERKAHGGQTVEEAKAAKATRDADAETRKTQPMPPEFRARYTVDVMDNLAIAGFGTTNGMRYKYVITESGRPVKVGYAFTYKSAYAAGEAYVAKMWRKGM